MPHHIFYKEDNGQYKVQLIHHQPETLSETKKENGFSVEMLPEQPDYNKETQRIVLLCDPGTKDLWYNIVDKE